MPCRSRFHRLGAWVFATLLLLEALAPGLASAAARTRGTALVEVCSVYGLRTVAVDQDGMPLDTAFRAPAPHDTSSSAGPGDCALAALPIFDLPPSDALSALPAPLEAAGLRYRPAPGAPPTDANRRWWSGLKQEPPAA